MSSSKKKLNLLTWNSRGIRHKTGELELLISEYKIDIVIVTETYLKPHVKISLPNFVCLRRDRLSRPGGGVAIFIKKSIKHARINPDVINLESVAIQINNNNKIITIAAAYNSPGDELLQSDLDAVLGLGSSVILSGDFNARHSHWNCSSTNRSGTMLFNYLHDTDTDIHFPNSHTHYPFNNMSPSTLDFALVKGFTPISGMHCIQALSSDHLPVFFALEGDVEVIPEIFFDYGRADWKGFRSFIECRLHGAPQIYTLQNTRQIDDDINFFTNLIEQGKLSFIPTRKNIPNKVKLTPEIIEYIKIKNRIKKQWQKNRSPQLKTLLNKLTSDIRVKIQIIKNDSWSRKLKKLNPADNSLWKIAKSIKNKYSDIPPLKNGDDIVTSNIQKTEVLANAFSTSYVLTQNYTHLKTQSKVDRSIQRLDKTRIDKKTINEITPFEIYNIAKSLKNNKAPGIDRLDNILIKNFPFKCFHFLTNIFNFCLSIGYFPGIWKVAKIIPIKKPGKADSIPLNYRPISLLPSLSKLFEKIILSRLKECLNSKIIDEQFGFREGHSTTHQLNRLTEHISANFNRKKSTGFLMLDVEKAFDTVWHEGLVYKLDKYKTPHYLIQIIRSYLQDRSYVVSLNNDNSTPRKIPAGVPQGSILGPYLYIIYTNDIPILKNTSLSIYADDTAVLTSSYGLKPIATKLQKSLHNLNKHLKKWKIKINDDKTEAIIFTMRRQPLPPPLKTEQGKNIEWKTSVRYLGLHLDSKLKYTKHIKEVRSKGLAAISALRPIFNRKSALTIKNKILLYKQLIRPILTYACPVWSNTCKNNFNKLQVIQNKAVKIIYNTPYYTNLKKLHTRYSIPTIKNHIITNTINYYKNISREHNNKLIAKIGNYDKVTLNFKYKHKMPKHIML